MGRSGEGGQPVEHVVREGGGGDAEELVQEVVQLVTSKLLVFEIKFLELVKIHKDCFFIAIVVDELL